MTSFVAESLSTPAERQGLTVLNNHQLLPSSPAEADSLFLFAEESNAMRAALKDTVGPERSRDSRHFKGDIHVVSYGAALQEGAGGVRSSSTLFDAERGRGVLADGDGSALASRTVAHGFMRALGRNKPDELITSYDATEAVRRAAGQADLVLGRTKSRLGNLYEDASASFAGFQFLYKGRVAISHSGDTEVMVYDPDGLCRRISQGSDNRLSGVTSRRDAKTASSLGHNDVVYLKPGKNIVVIGSKGAVGGLSALRIGELIDTLNPDLDNPDSGAAIAEHIMASPEASGHDGSVMAVVVDVEETADNRSWLRKSLDPLRVSTYLFGAMAAIKRPGISRRELYDAPTAKGESWRRLSRAVDVAAAAVGAAATYNLAKHLELDLNSLTDNGVYDDIVRTLGFDPAAVPVTPDVAGGDAQALLPDVPPAEQPPGENITPTEIQDDYPEERAASGHDSSTGRASNASDWSAMAIEYYGQKEGLPQAAVQELTGDWEVIDTVNNGLYADNPDVASHPQNYLMDGGVYDTGSQNDAAHKVVLDWKAEHMPVPPPPAVEPTPAVVAPAEQPAAAGGGLYPPFIGAESPSSSPPNMNNFIWPAAIAAGGTGVVLGTAAVVRRRRARHLNEIAEREKAGQARSHNAKHRKRLDGQSDSKKKPANKPPEKSGKTKPPTRRLPASELFSGAT